MKKTKLYRYLGRNGIITSLVELMNIDFIPMYRLEASPGFMITNGEKTVYVADIFTEELDQWYEVVDPNIKSSEDSANQN